MSSAVFPVHIVTRVCACMQIQYIFAATALSEISRVSYARRAAGDLQHTCVVCHNL